MNTQPLWSVPGRWQLGGLLLPWLVLFFLIISFWTYLFDHQVILRTWCFLIIVPLSLMGTLWFYWRARSTARLLSRAERLLATAVVFPCFVVFFSGSFGLSIRTKSTPIFFFDDPVTRVTQTRHCRQNVFWYSTTADIEFHRCVHSELPYGPLRAVGSAQSNSRGALLIEVKFREHPLP